jgi:hypothetical protein
VTPADVFIAAVMAPICRHEGNRRLVLLSMSSPQNNYQTFFSFAKKINFRMISGEQK